MDNESKKELLEDKDKSQDNKGRRNGEENNEQDSNSICTDDPSGLIKSNESNVYIDDDNENSNDNEQNFHEQIYRQRNSQNVHINQTHEQNHQHHHHHRHHHHHHQHQHGHKKELIKPDTTQKLKDSALNKQQHLIAKSNNNEQSTESNVSAKVIATVVDEEQLHKRLIESRAIDRVHQIDKNKIILKNDNDINNSTKQVVNNNNDSSSTTNLKPQALEKSSSSSSSASNGKVHSSSIGKNNDESKSPPPAAIIIPPNVAKSLSARRTNSTRMENQRFDSHRNQISSQLPPQPPSSSSITTTNHDSESSSTLTQPINLNDNNSLPESVITREQLEYGPLLKQGEVQVLFRSPELDTNLINRHLKDEQAKLVAPNLKQSPISISTKNQQSTYELLNKPLLIEYPSVVENLRLNNTGFSWEVKIPYQISMTTALYGAHLYTNNRFRLDNLHCHWGLNDNEGSEHKIDDKFYSAELHFVHYNMEKYHTMSKAARHPDGLVVLSVFLDAQDNFRNHAELEKIVNNLKLVKLKGQQTIIKQGVRIENLLPINKSYWSYQGSMTTAPFFESVTWFILKNPIKCSKLQIQKFRNLKSTLTDDDGKKYNNNNENGTINLITSNHRKIQPLNGRTIVNYDEQHNNNSHSISNSSICSSTTSLKSTASTTSSLNRQTDRKNCNKTSTNSNLNSKVRNSQ